MKKLEKFVKKCTFCVVLKYHDVYMIALILQMWRRHMTATALIAEDDLSLRRIMSKAFRLAGFTVKEAGDGHEAMQHLQQNLPDLIVLDHNMPGPSGLTILSHVRQAEGGQVVTIILMTGDHLVEQVPEAALADYFLLKPVSMHDLTTIAWRSVTSAAKTEPDGKAIREAMVQQRPDLFKK